MGRWGIVPRALCVACMCLLVVGAGGGDFYRGEAPYNTFGGRRIDCQR